jgi:Ca2+-binding RTX toxin-like protein
LTATGFDWRSLETCVGATCRPAGADMLFGGAGVDIGRNDPGDATYGDDGSIITVPTGHARDADVMAGDNAQILRLVGTFGREAAGTAADPYAYLTFAYDTYEGGLRLIPRAVQLLDYTFGGPAFDAASAATDRGEGDELHGEAGDDVAYGMVGNDVLFGDGQHDDLVGGYGDDWFSGGTGDDAIIGDDGRISTSRNSSSGWDLDPNGSTLYGNPCEADGATCYSEPLYGVLALLPEDANSRTIEGNVLDEVIYTPGQVQIATIHVTGALKRTVNLTPFNVDPMGIDPLFRPAGGYDDIIFGGLGDDSIHGGSGDDAISGAEALVAGYAPNYVTSCPDTGTPADCTAVRDGLVRIDFGHPVNPGDVLRFNPDDVDGWHFDRTRRAGEFDLYDEYEPRRAILFNDAAEVWTCTDYSPSGKVCTGNADITAYPHHFFLNNSRTEGPVVNGCVAFAPNGTCEGFGDANTDGNDVLFGDLGNDWMVGGTGNDTLWGGFGNDLLNADDDLEAGCVASLPNGTCTETDSTWLNDGPDTHPTYEDRAVGGAGRDVLIGNTGGDRLIDWVGEFNSYIVPFAPFGIATVSRQVPPALFEFLYALSAAQGADPTRAADTNIDFADRNGEPNGEVGLVTQKDKGLWQDQTGAPADPQAGNIPGGKRDVLRTATFDDGAMQAFFRDSGAFEVAGATLIVAAESQGQDAAAVWYVDAYLPVFYEVHAQILMAKATGGWKANAYVIFDYFSPTDFKFAGIDDSINKLVMGYRDAAGWHVVRQASVKGGVRADTWYDVVVYVNGTTVWVDVAGKELFTHTFAPRIIDGEAVGLHKGLIGLGSDNARGRFDNVSLQVLPPDANVDLTDDFDDGFGIVAMPALAGDWSVADGVLASRAGPDPAMATVDPGGQVSANAFLEITARIMVSAGGSGGLFFDAYAADDHKFVLLDLAAQAVTIGHVAPGRAAVVDASVAMALASDTWYTVVVTIRGASVSVLVNGRFGGSWGFNSALADGELGLLAVVGPLQVDRVRVRTDGLATSGGADVATSTAELVDPAADPPPSDSPPAAPADPTVSFTTDTVTVAEGDVGQTLLDVEVALSEPVDHDVVIWVATSSGSALAGEDFEPTLTAVTIPAGHTSATFQVAILGDEQREDDEWFTLALVDPDGATLGDVGSTTVVVTNDDTGPRRG